VAETDPVEHVENGLRQIVLAHARHAQRQRDIVIGGQVIDQAEILENHTQTAAEGRQLRARLGDYIASEHADRAARRTLREIEQFQQRGLARPARAGEEIEPTGKQSEGQIAQNLTVRAVAKADIVEARDLFLAPVHSAVHRASPPISPEHIIRPAL
jgi:hypothetical protein